MDIKRFWDSGLSYEQYLNHAQESFDHPKTKAEEKSHDYYKLGIQRMNRMAKSYSPDTGQMKRLIQKRFTGRILIIAEAWCGDCAQVVPVITKFFEHHEVRITLRDQEPSLMGDFLTGGSKSIPIVIFLDDQFRVINYWGSRPKYGQELYTKYKNNPEGYPKEQFYNDLQKYYAKNKGFDTIEEILELI